MRDTWSEFAARCERAKYLSPEDARIGTIGARADIWERAARAAERFWLSAQAQTLAAFVAPLLST